MCSRARRPSCDRSGCSVAEPLLWLGHRQLGFLRCPPQAPALRGPALYPSPPQEWPGHGWCWMGSRPMEAALTSVHRWLSGSPEAAFPEPCLTSLLPSATDMVRLSSRPCSSSVFPSSALRLQSLQTYFISVLLHCVCCTKYHRPERLEQQKCIVSSFCGLQVPDQV